MKTIKYLTVIAILMGIAFISSCKKDDAESPAPSTPYTYNPTPYEFYKPNPVPYFRVPDYNKTTVQGVEMGRRIYFDKMLSLGGPLEGKACASCHAPQTNFADNAPGVSVMPHTNLNWSEEWLWNGAEKGTLEDVMEFEIHEFFQADISMFNADATYKRMNYEAFGTEEVTLESMSYAMAQWLRSHLSFNSKLDKYYEGKAELTPEERLGFDLFNTEKGDCFHCHSMPLTTDLRYHNIGLDSVYSDFGQGRFLVTGKSTDLGKFKTPSLRNVAVTAPYMHDGRYKTLEEVVEHYNSKVAHSSQLDPIMTKPGKEFGLGFADYEKKALVAFLKTLTDEEYLNDERWEDPFE
jgi:cytochrome c peroxidase